MARPAPKATHTKSAKLADLRYVTDDGDAPGISRKATGTGFTYLTPQGRPLRDARTLARIRSLAIPPAWTNVWISPDENGHVQATGRDARGRKQYRYHPRWTEIRDEVKYRRMIAFGRVLPLIRRRTAADLKKPPLSRDRVLATVVQLLEKTLIRVGNEEYTRANGSYGLTTLQDHHVQVRGAKLTFQFRAKSGVHQDINVTDALLAKSVKRCQDLPGQTLFQYIDDEGQQRLVDSGDVNAYLKEITGEAFTAKDFRTWAGTVLAAVALCNVAQGDSETAGKRQIVAAVESVAKQLGNTRAVCRRCYIHPAVVDSYLDGTTIEVLSERAAVMAESRTKLKPNETAVLALLRRRLAIEARASREKRRASTAA